MNTPETDNKSSDYNTLPEAPCEHVTIVSKRQDEQKKFINFLENKLNVDIGFYYWKRYVAGSFWAQLATPINLAITLMTALTTASVQITIPSARAFSVFLFSYDASLITK